MPVSCEDECRVPTKEKSGMPSFLSFNSYWSSAALETNIVVFLNLLGALLLGLLVGYERSYHGRAAGMRTYGLVCMASCALPIIAGYPNAWYGGHGPPRGPVGPTRGIQGVGTRLGLLGARPILGPGFNFRGPPPAAPR